MALNPVHGVPLCRLGGAICCFRRSSGASRQGGLLCRSPATAQCNAALSEPRRPACGRAKHVGAGIALVWGETIGIGIGIGIGQVVPGGVRSITTPPLCSAASTGAPTPGSSTPTSGPRRPAGTDQEVTGQSAASSLGRPAGGSSTGTRGPGGWRPFWAAVTHMPHDEGVRPVRCSIGADELARRAGRPFGNPVAGARWPVQSGFRSAWQTVK